jgi:hypothetical protein
MASFLLCFLILQAPGAIPGSVALPAPLIRSIDLDAGTLLGDPSLLAADTLALVVESQRQAFCKLSERGEVLATGKLLPGKNTLRFTRPGLAAGSRSFFFLLDLLEQGTASQKFLRVQVTVEGAPAMEPEAKADLSGNFGLEMYHSGRRFGYRKKNMVDLLKLKTGPVAPVPDPGLSGAAGRSPSSGQSISVLGLGMALAKFLAGKKAEKRIRERAAEAQKKRLSMTFPREKREIEIVIELQVE